MAFYRDFGRWLCRARLTRRLTALSLTVLFVAATTAPAFAQPANEGPITLAADHIEYNTLTGNVTADGHVKATRGDTTITADHLTGNLNAGQVRATGHVTLVQPGRTATGETLTYNYRMRVGEMGPVVVKYPPWTATARSFTTAGGQSVAYNAATTPCDPRHPAFLVRARKVVVVPDDYLTAYGAILYVYGVPVFYVPAYTASLKKGRNARNARSGPSVGYDNFDGVWVEYAQFIRMGGWDNQVRVRYGTRAGLSGEDLISRRFNDHLIKAHLGRTVTFDQNGNQAQFDEYSLDVLYDSKRVGRLPLTYTVEANAGDYQESQTGVSTGRVEGLLTLATDTFQLSPAATIAASGYYRYDAYGRGQVRSIIAASTALTRTLNRVSSTTLSYNFAAVNGSTPFSFDSIGPDSAVSLSYSYYPGGRFQSGTISGTYDFLTRQTTSSLSVAFTVSPSIQFSAVGSYNFTTQQLTEVDYVVHATCDCVSLGFLYRMFPNSPSSNQWYITFGVNTLPGVPTLKFGTAQ